MWGLALAQTLVIRCCRDMALNFQIDSAQVWPVYHCLCTRCVLITALSHWPEIRLKMTLWHAGKIVKQVLLSWILLFLAWNIISTTFIKESSHCSLSFFLCLLRIESAKKNHCPPQALLFFVDVYSRQTRELCVETHICELQLVLVDFARLKVNNLHVINPQLLACWVN